MTSKFKRKKLKYNQWHWIRWFYIYLSFKTSVRNVYIKYSGSLNNLFGDWNTRDNRSCFCESPSWQRWGRRPWRQPVPRHRNRCPSSGSDTGFSRCPDERPGINFQQTPNLMSTINQNCSIKIFICKRPSFFLKIVDIRIGLWNWDQADKVGNGAQDEVENVPVQDQVAQHIGRSKIFSIFFHFHFIWVKIFFSRRCNHKYFLAP